MKKRYQKILIVLAVLITVYQLLYWTYIFRLYKSGSLANEPNLPLNSYFFASNLIVPQIKDFVCYQFEDEMTGNLLRVHRLMAQEGDVLEIKNGDVYVNGLNIDVNLNLWHTYKLKKDEFNETNLSEAVLEQARVKNEEYYIPMTQKEAQEKGLENRRVKLLPTEEDKEVFKTYKIKGNRDHFGPITIPKGKIFVIGDNRDNSYDSRFMGLVDASAIKGVLITN